MTPKQLNNVVALARLGFQTVSGDKSVSEEALAELATDLAAGKRFAVTYDPIPEPAEAVLP